MYLVMTESYYLLLLFFGIQLGNCNAEPIINKDKEFKVEEASQKDWPFLVSIGKKGSSSQSYTYRQGHFCGGALVTTTHIVTSAHCLVDEKPSDIRVLIGFTKFDEAEEVYDVLTWKIYNTWPRKLDTSDDHDIAVIKLKNPVTSAKVETIPLYPKSVNKDTIKLQTAGWGQTEDFVTSPSLLRIDLSVIPTEICEENLSHESGEPFSVAIQHLCTRSDYSLHLGEGDSGGPTIIIEDGVKYLVGVNEAHCNKSCTFINTHSKISYYRNFIRNMMLTL